MAQTALADETLAWRRSSYCADGSCVEIAHVGDTMLVRDSKLEVSPVLTFSSQAWAEFCGGVASGEFD